MNNLSFDGYFKNAECVGFLGLGKSNRAILSLLPKDKRVIIRSETPLARGDIPKGTKPEKVFIGKEAFDTPHENILFLSPSVRRERRELLKFWESGVLPSSDFELFLTLNKKEIFSVTGSDGKSTTATLAASLLSTQKSKVTPIGNVGTPFIKSVKSRTGKYAVLELSSFSLHYAVPHSKRALVTNITQNHLNWHKDFDEYIETKLSLLEAADEAVISADDIRLSAYSEGKEVFASTSVKKSFKELKNCVKASVYYTAENGYITRNGEKLFPISILSRQEPHNIKNLLSSLALTDGFVAQERAENAAKEFTGLSHRLEKVAMHNGIQYINSSIDTSVSRCSESLNSFNGNVIIILGGRSKGEFYDGLREPLSKNVKLAVLTGENKQDIYRDIRGSTDCALIDDFEDAVTYAAAAAETGDTVLLSPASTSYDVFSNFEERGNKFKEIILNYTNNH